MSLTLHNFVPIGLVSAPREIHINSSGHVVSAVPAHSRRIDCEGAYLSLGWCDLHVHVWYGGSDISLRVSQVGRKFGVTAMADAGSAGEANFHGFREYVVEPETETIRAFLNIGSIGLVAANRVSELIDMRSIDIDRTLSVIEANRDVICGVKVRASGIVVGTWGLMPARIAKRVAEIAGLPLMAHVGEPVPLIDEVMELLTPGDILTHCYNGKAAGSILGTPAILDIARRRQEEGIVFDVGHGRASFDFATARRAIDAGLLPDTISTDLHSRNIDGPVHSLALTASKMLALGMPLEDCIAAIAQRPREIIGLQDRERAEFTVFTLDGPATTVMDSVGEEITLERRLSPRLTVIGTSVRPAKSSTS